MPASRRKVWKLAQGISPVSYTHLEQSLALFGGHSSFPQDHGVGIDIVVDGGELLLHMELHAFDDLVHHGLPVEHGEVLDDLHEMCIRDSHQLYRAFAVLEFRDMLLCGKAGHLLIITEALC